MRDPSTPSRPLIVEHFDLQSRPGSVNTPLVTFLRHTTESMRQRCDKSDPVFGDMRALIRYPDKLILYAEYAPELYDLSADPGEIHDLASARPDAVRELTLDMQRLASLPAAGSRSAPDAATGVLPPPEVLDRLRALGYVVPREQETAAPSEHTAE